MSKNKKFNLLVIAYTISSTGTGISSFIIPYLIINLSNGERYYAYNHIGILIFSLIITPIIGVLIDRFSRKGILLSCELISVITNSLLIGIYLTYTSVSIVVLICLTLLSLINFVYSIVKIPTTIAFIQESFMREEYIKMNSAIEIQGQFASFVSAGITAVLASKIDVWIFFLVDILCCAVAFILFLFIPYSKTIIYDSPTKRLKIDYFGDLKIAFGFINRNKTLMTYFLCTLIPTIMVLIGNYVNPVFVYKELKYGADIQGYSSLIYAFSAMAGGIFAAFISKKFGNYYSSLITYTIYFLGILLIISYPIVGIFLFARLFAGISNSASRVIRNNVMMHTIPPDLIGRVNSFLSSFSLVVQIVLVIYFSSIFEVFGGVGVFIFIAIVMTLFLFVLIGVGKSTNLRNGVEAKDG